MSKLHLQAVALALVFLLTTCQLSFPLHFEQSTAHAEQQPKHSHRKLSHYLRSQGSSHDAVTVPSPATPYYMYYFTLPFTVDGTPYKARISTASSTFLIKGPSAAGIPTTKYPCTSCTSKADNAVFYFDGYASTFDPLYLPVSISSPALNLTLNQSVFVAKAVSPSYEAVEAVLGLAFPSRGLNPRSSFL